MTVWTTKAGEEIDITDMSDSHVMNTLRMLRRALDNLREEENAGYSVYCRLQGEMAEYYTEKALDEVSKKAINTRWWVDNFVAEAKRRSLLT